MIVFKRKLQKHYTSRGVAHYLLAIPMEITELIQNADGDVFVITDGVNVLLSPRKTGEDKEFAERIKEWLK